MRIPKIRLVAFFGTLMLVFALGTMDAQAWTWSSATHPAGSGDMGGGGSGGGVYSYHGMYYLPGSGHMDSGLGVYRYEFNTGSGGLGYSSHSTYDSVNGQSRSPDIGMIATGTDPIAPNMRVSTGWTNAPITDVSHGNDAPAGMTLCHSGVSAATMAAGGYRCGTLTSACTKALTGCVLHNANGVVSGGDSSGPVWWYSTGGVKLYGWIVSMIGTSGQDAGFIPVWVMQSYVWPSSQVWPAGGNITAGNDQTGCFVVTTGCVRS